MRLLVKQPNSTSAINLDSLPLWRLSLGALYRGHPCVSLVLRYPPGDSSSVVGLLHASLPFSETVEEAERIADASLVFGRRDKDELRIEEAMRLFKNQARPVSSSILAAATAECRAVVGAYYLVRDWCMAEKKTALELSVGGQSLLCVPNSQEDSGEPRTLVDLLPQQKDSEDSSTKDEGQA